MFQKCLLRTIVALQPELLGPATPTAIEWALEEQYTNRVMHGHGLVIAVLGVEWVGEGRIFHSDGKVYYEVVWSGLLFCPETGELLMARVQSQNARGMFLSNDFFEDFYIPRQNMEEETRWDREKRRWVYCPDEETEMEFETGRNILVRVYALEFKTGHEVDSESSRFNVNCRINTPCLGMLNWDWENEEGSEDDE